MNEKIKIVSGGILAGIFNALIVQTIFNLIEGIILAKLIAIASVLILTGLVYAITYALKGLPKNETEGVLAGIFAGAVGGVLAWVFAELFFAPLSLNALLITGLIGGFLFSIQIDPRPIADKG